METGPAPPRRGLAGQIPHLDRSRGTSLGSVRGQTHRQDVQVVHCRRRRAVLSAPCLASCSSASPSPKVATSSETSTRTCVATTQRHVPSWATHSARAFTGPPRSLMPTRSYAPVRGASSMPIRLISRLMPFKRFPSHVLSPCGGWTSSGPCERRPGDTLTCWSPWISSLNGSRRAQSQTSGRSKPCRFSLISSTGSGYRIPSSPMGPNLQAGSS
jgi:hypothetical protein